MTRILQRHAAWFATLGRFLHRAELLQITGRTYRTYRSYQVLHLDFAPKNLRELFDDQSSVTVLGKMFATEQATVVYSFLSWMARSRVL